MEPQARESYQQTFRRGATHFISRGATSQEQNQAARVSDSYLSNILGHRSLLKRVMSALFGSSAFTDELDQRLSSISQRENQALTRIERLKINILPAVKDKIRKSSSMTGSVQRWADLKDYLDKSDAPWAKKKSSWCNIAKHSVHFIGLVKANKTLNGVDENLYSYQDIYRELAACHRELQQVATEKYAIRTEILKPINEYLYVHQNDTDPLQVAKTNVMKALKTYITKPIQDNWNKVEKATTSPANSGWDQGAFSQVSQVHDEITTFKMGNKL